MSLTYSRARQDRAAIQRQYKQFHEAMAKSDRRLIALGAEQDSDIALVHFWDKTPGAAFFDIDPAFMAREGRAWKLLPIFRPPSAKVDYLDAEQQARLSSLLKACSRVSSKLPTMYAKQLEGRGRD